MNQYLPIFISVQEEDAAWERVAKEVFVSEAQPPPSPSAFSSSQPGASAATTRGLILKGVKWRLPTPTTTEVAGEGMEGKAEPEVRFVPHEQFDSAPLPVNKFRWPYVYLYVAICKEGDTYGAQRPSIKNWIATMQDKQQEWLLLLLHVGKVPVRKDMFRKINRITYDTKRDGFERCVEMKLPDAEGGDKEGLDEFTRKLRVCVGNSLGKQINFYQAEVDKLYESRAIPGWNYCNFFAAKEALAFTFVRANMLEEALTLYEELEDQFYQLNGLERRDRPTSDETPETQSAGSSPEMASASDVDKSVSAPASPSSMRRSSLNISGTGSGSSGSPTSSPSSLRRTETAATVAALSSSSPTAATESPPPPAATAALKTAAKNRSFSQSEGRPVHHRSGDREARRDSRSRSSSSLGRQAPAKLPTMDKFGGESGSDKSSVLDVTVKDYRKLIFENAISEFDFRKYVFARQSELRFMLHRPWDVASNAVLFIQMLSRDLQKKKTPASEETRNFSISWVFSACLCVVDACQEAAKAMKFGDFAEKSQQPKELNPQASDFFMLSAALGDLSNYARTKLKELGKLHGLFDDKAPLVPPPDPGAVDDSSSASSSSSSSAAEEAANPGEQEAPPTDDGGVEKEGEGDSNGKDDMAIPPRAPGITNASLNRALRSQKEFDQLYMDVSMQAVRFYKTSMRKRLKQHVKEEIANLFLVRGDYAKAEAMYKSLCQRYAKERWLLLDNTIHAKLAHCQLHLRDYTGFLASALALLSFESRSTREDKEAHLKRLCAVTHHHIPPGAELSMRQVLRITALTASQQSFTLGQTLSLDFVIESSLPSPVVFQGLRAAFVDQEEAAKAAAAAVAATAAASAQPSPGAPLPSPRVLSAPKVPAALSSPVAHRRTRSILNSHDIGDAARATDAIVLAQSDVCLSPGVNKFTLSTRARLALLSIGTAPTGLTSSCVDKKGNFKLRAIEAVIGQLRLTEYFDAVPDKERIEVAVQENERSLQMGIAQQSPYLLVGYPQALLLTLHTKQDSFADASVVFSSATLQLLSSPVTATVTLASGEKREISVQLREESNELRLPPCEEQSTVHLSFSALAPPNTGFNHQVTARLAYRRMSGEKMDATVSNAFYFVHPFSPKTFVVPFGPRLYVQVVLRCQVGWTRLLDYRLRCAPSHRLIHEANTMLVGQTVINDQELSLVFQVESTDGAGEEASEDSQLEINYQLEGSDESSPLTFTCPISLDLPRHLYEVQMEYADSGVVGNVIPVTLHVIRLASSSSRDEGLAYEVLPKEPWLVLGLKKARFTLAVGERRTFQFKLLPISPGYLPVPAVTIHGVPMAQVRCLHSARQIHVLPKETLSSYFTKAT